MTKGEHHPALTKSQSELIAYLFDSAFGSFSAKFSEWVQKSPRFAQFADNFKDKIRKKVRTTKGSTSQTDLFHELLVAYWLLREKRFELTYEPYSAGKTRGPDFAVTFRSNFTFNIEVTHIEKLSVNQSGDNSMNIRLVDVICRKLLQMAANNANILLISSTAPGLSSLDLQDHLTWIKGKAEQGEVAFLNRQHFSSRAEFFKQFQRLSAILLFAANDFHSVDVWTNPQAQIKLPEAVQKILAHRSL